MSAFSEAAQLTTLLLALNPTESLHRRQRAVRLLVPLGQRAARGLLLRVFDGSQPRRALWLDPMPERLPTATAATPGRSTENSRDKWTTS